MQEEKIVGKEEIVIIDEGIAGDALLGTESFCCGSVLMFIVGG